jgi:hypothetical protein
MIHTSSIADPFNGFNLEIQASFALIHLLNLVFRHSSLIPFVFVLLE